MNEQDWKQGYMRDLASALREGGTGGLGGGMGMMGGMGQSSVPEAMGSSGQRPQGGAINTFGGWFNTLGQGTPAFAGGPPQAGAPPFAGMGGNQPNRDTMGGRPGGGAFAPYQQQANPSQPAPVTNLPSFGGVPSGGL